ncbi:polyprenyl synthetase family protein [Streptomyces dysideae]|nr:polyprenyl synthetase family protein [Streptomyces dysideae]
MYRQGRPLAITDLLGPNPRDRGSALLDSLLAGSAAVEEGLLGAVKSDVRFIAESGRSLLRTGKALRLRPLLVLLAARFGDPHAPGVVPAAVAVELTHVAALAHDGVRGAEAAGHTRPDPHALLDTSVALLTGDFLFARASQILADLGPDAVRVQTAAYERLVTGQILSRTGPSEGCDPVAHHREVAAARTGSLTGVSGRLGALAAGAEDHVGDALARYGERLGTALGLTDDVLGPAEDDLLRAEVLTGPCPPPAHPAPGRVLREALCSALQARAALKDLPDCAARGALAGLCDAAAARARP